MVSTRELALLSLIAEYRLLLTSQIARLTGTGLRAAQKKIGRLCESGNLEVSRHIFGSIRGRPENVYSLTKTGVKHLLRAGEINSESAVGGATAEGITSIGHELLINWFRIHLLQIDQYIADLDTEFLSAKTPFLPPTSTGAPFIADKVSVNDREEIFVPDGVFSIASVEQDRRLLFFLEVDMSTESIRSGRTKSVTIAKKVRNYYLYFMSEAYKRYEKMWQSNLSGFRVLFLSNTVQRMGAISRYLRTNPSHDFIWITDAGKMFRHGASAKIWARAGKSSRQLESILGPTLSCQLPLHT